MEQICIISVPRFKLVVLITLVVAQLAIPLATASSRPEWARDGVYFIYGAVRLEYKVASREELESAINEWRFAGIRDYEFIIEIKFISVSELGVNYMATYYSYIPTISPSPPKTINCPWDGEGCGTDYGPFYINLQKFLEKLPAGTETKEERCDEYNYCVVYTTSLNTISTMTRFGTLELYEYTYKFEHFRKYANGTIERQREYTMRFWIHKSTGIVIEAFYSSLELKECPPGKTCWSASLVVLLDSNVPQGVESPAPTQTTPQVSPTLIQTPVTPITTPTTPYTPTPTQVEVTKTPSPTTQTQQPVAPDQLSGTLLPIAVAVLAVVAVIVVFKILKK